MLYVQIIHFSGFVFVIFTTVVSVDTRTPS